MTVSHYISGHWHKDGELSTTRNPGTGQPVTTYHQGTVALLEEAVAAARGCFDRGVWRAAARQRAACLLEAADRIEARHDEIAMMLAQEMARSSHRHATRSRQRSMNAAITPGWRATISVARRNSMSGNNRFSPVSQLAWPP